jgi:hypothetical protein
MAELLIRASMKDHLVVNDFLALASGPRLFHSRPLIDQLVADAHVAVARPTLSEAAQAAGVPYLIDPNTPLLQAQVAEDDRWAKLPFASARALQPGDVDAKNLAKEVVEFELEHGATRIVAPYFYASSPLDPWFVLNLELIDETIDYMDRSEIRLDVVFILCAQLHSFGNHMNWTSGVDRFIERIGGAPRRSAGLVLSPAGAGDDGLAKVRRLFLTAQHIQSSVETMAWRQGVFGPGLVAAGLAGYECGMGSGEQSNVVSQLASRKPRDNGKHGGGGGPGIYIETLKRSIPKKASELLFSDIHMRAQLVCDDESCCDTWKATIAKPREHAVRARHRELAALNEQPSSRWRLTHIAREAQQAVAVAEQANRLLEGEGVATRVQTKGYEALAAVASEMADGDMAMRIA